MYWGLWWCIISYNVLRLQSALIICRLMVFGDNWDRVVGISIQLINLIIFFIIKYISSAAICMKLRPDIGVTSIKKLCTLNLIDTGESIKHTAREMFCFQWQLQDSSCTKELVSHNIQWGFWLIKMKIRGDPFVKLYLQFLPQMLSGSSWVNEWAIPTLFSFWAVLGLSAPWSALLSIQSEILWGAVWR